MDQETLEPRTHAGGSRNSPVPSAASPAPASVFDSHSNSVGQPPSSFPSPPHSSSRVASPSGRQSPAGESVSSSSSSRQGSKVGNSASSSVDSSCGSVSSVLRRSLESRAGGAAASASGLSAAEQLFLEEGVEYGVREDGRACSDVLPSDVITHVLPQCHASAAVRSSENAVLCGVQLQVGRPSAAAPGEGLVFLGVDCAAAMGSRVGGGGAAGGRSSSDFAEGAGVSQRMQSLLVDLMLGPAALDKSKLSILRGKLCYHVYIDCVVLMAGGSLLDALSLSVVAALRTLMLPNVFVETEGEEEDEEGEAGEGEADSAVLNIACDERETAGRPFPAENIPLVVTVGQIGRHYVWDMRSSEEAACSSRLAVAVAPAGFKSVGLQTLGNSLVDPATFSSLVVYGQQERISCEDKLSTS